MARYIGNPIHFFIQDYYPGSLTYRPLGMFSWWLSYKLFGLNPILHNLVNPLLHVINTFLFALLLGQLLGKRRWMILLSSLLFLVHPVAVSTSLWQGDRFDLLATGFILLTLYLFFRFLFTGRRVYLLSSLLASLGGILSKEVSFGLCLLVALIFFAFPNLNEKGERSKRVFLLLPYFLIALVLLIIRFSILRGTSGALFGDGLIRTLGDGFLKWIRLMPDIYVPHVDVLGVGDFAKWMCILYLLFLAVILGSSIKGKRPIPWPLFLLGFGIIGISGILMAPVMNFSTFVDPREGVSFFVVIEGRFYYLSLIGFVVILDGSLVLIDSFFADRRPVRRYSKLLVPFSVVALFPYALSSLALGQGWNELTNGRERRLVELAGQAVQQVPSIVQGTKVFLLGTEQHSHFREFGDTILKSIAPENSKVIHCLVFTEKPPWYNFVLKEDAEKVEIKPLRYMRYRGKEFPPGAAGGYVHFFFTFPDGDEIVKDPRAVFLEFLAGEEKFVDVTEDVRAGRRAVRFFNDRPVS